MKVVGPKLVKELTWCVLALLPLLYSGVVFEAQQQSHDIILVVVFQGSTIESNLHHTSLADQTNIVQVTSMKDETFLRVH